MKQEWSIMRRRAWNFSEVRERSEVIAEAAAENCEIHLGRVHGLCLDANSEVPPEHPARHYRGRILFADCDTTRDRPPDANHVVMPELSAAQVSFEN